MIQGNDSLLVRVAALEGVIEEEITWASALHKVTPLAPLSIQVAPILIVAPYPSCFLTTLKPLHAGPPGHSRLPAGAAAGAAAQQVARSSGYRVGTFFILYL